MTVPAAPVTPEEAKALDRVVEMAWDDHEGVPTAVESLALARGYKRLAEAIRVHRAQKADDRCIEDDDRLYAALCDGIPCDRRVGDKEAMLANCARFIDRRCKEGGWPSYVELETRCADQARQMEDLRKAILRFDGPTGPLVSEDVALPEELRLFAYGEAYSKPK